MTFQTTLTDLDELLFQVRDKNSRLYLSEAINAYKGGAFRAAIVSVWIAVAYDIISKIRELASQGDGNAEAFVKKMDGYSSNITPTHIKKLQEIENKLLDKAFCDYEFINYHEHDTLTRLKTVDRNRCAHPAFYDDETLYQPTPELARMYIVQAVTALLRHPPIQGKSALDKILEEMERPSFPRDKERVYELLHNRYLKQAKSVLVKTLLDVILKKIFDLGDLKDIDKKGKLLNVLSAIQQSRPKDYETHMIVLLSKNIRKHDDEQVKKIVLILNEHPSCWDWLETADRIRIEEIIIKLLTPYPPVGIDYTLQPDAYRLISKIHDIKDRLIPKFDKLNPCMQVDILKYNLMPECADKAVKLYEEVNDWSTAGEIGKEILLPMIPSFSQDHIQKIIAAVKNNDEVQQARKTPETIEEIFAQTCKKYPELHNDWIELIKAVKDNTCQMYRYPVLRKKMEDE
ncbi:MAG: hypothetical protein D3910_15970, partial [Candidatus Electrothrix sp. ATG2]|nr:hypothetical protein [Candidatus Electrothrix sp. ATG2]